MDITENVFFVQGITCNSFIKTAQTDAIQFFINDTVRFVNWAQSELV